MIVIEAYECFYCGKVFKQKSSCKKHEDKCFFNPVTRSCAGCNNSILTDHMRNNQGFLKQERICLAGHDIKENKNLRTNCAEFIEKREEDESGF